MITLIRFRRIEATLRAAGYGDMIDWSEAIQAPTNADEFAREAIYVICNGGMAVAAGSSIAKKCIDHLAAGGLASDVFRHPGKAPAIDRIWNDRHELFEEFGAAASKLEFLDTLPWIGPVTRYHLAKNLGADEAKPDVHMERLARGDRTTTHKLCRRLARASAYRIATVDSVLWRACADGVLNSRVYEAEGWKAAFRPYALEVEREELNVAESTGDVSTDPAD